jgi:hypothetical protein
VRQKAAFTRFATGSGDPLHRNWIGEDVDRFEQALPFLGRDENAGRDSVARDLNGLAALRHVAEELE